jgi:hypothetical protein
MNEFGIVGEWSVKDVLAHLIEWEQMVLGWHKAGLRDEIFELPAPGFKWNQTLALNQQIYEKHRDRPLEEVLEQFTTSYQEILKVIQGLSNDDFLQLGDMLGPRKLPWEPISFQQPVVITFGQGKESARG